MGVVGNNTTYAPYVQSAAYQARWMRHWRNTDEAVADETREQVATDFAEAIERAFGT